MSPRTQKQLEEIRKDRKQAIMDTALEEFASHGYEIYFDKYDCQKSGCLKRFNV